MNLEKALGLLLLLFVLPATATEKPKSFRLSYSLQSSPKELRILRDNGKWEAIKPEERGKRGWNEITITAPQFGTRRIRFFLSPDSAKNIEVNLSKPQRDFEPDFKSAEQSIAETKLRKLPSLCTWYQERTSDKSVCQRLSFQEDISFSEPSPFPREDMRILARNKELKAYLKSLHTLPVAKQAEEEMIESFFRRYPGLSALYQLTAYRALLRGDCPRVHSVFVEAQQHLEAIEPLVFYKALCMEIQDHTDTAILFLQENIKNSASTPPYLLYTLGRLQLRRAPSEASKVATRCLTLYRYDLSCQEIGMMASRLQEKVYKSQRFHLEEATFKTYRKLEEELNPESAEALFFTVSTLYNSFPQSLEYLLFLSWINEAYGLGSSSPYLNQKMQGASILAGKSLESTIYSLEKRNLTQLLTPVYRARLRQEPNDPNLWLRLIRAHYRAGECPELLKVSEEGFEILPKYNGQLLQMEANCLMEANKLSEALLRLQKILSAQPKLWSSYFSLAELYDRMKKPKEALPYFQQTLQWNPPPEVKGKAEARISEIQVMKGK